MQANKNTPWLKIIWTVTGILLVTASVVFASSYFINPIIDTNEPIQTIDTSDWGIFKNEEWGYEVKYPPHLTPKTIETDKYLNLVYIDRVQNADVERISIGISASNLNKEVEYQKWIVIGHILATLKDEEDINLDGYIGKRLTFEPSDPNEGVKPFTIIVFNDGKYSYSIHVSTNIIDAVLSTFKFLKGEVSTKPCKITGCNGEICSDEDVASACVVLPEYECYKTAKCERQADGECGWTQTEELKVCLRNIK